MSVSFEEIGEQRNYDIFQNTAFRLVPVGETGLSHRLTVYKIVGHFYGLSYLKISGNNRVENIFLESVTFQFHARMRSSEVAQSLKSYGHFSDHGVETALSHCHDAFFGYSKYINPRLQRGCHGNLSSDWLIMTAALGSCMYMYTC